MGELAVFKIVDGSLLTCPQNGVLCGHWKRALAHRGDEPMTAALTLVIKRARYAVKDFADASAVYSALRDKSGLGGSKWPSGYILQHERHDDPGALIARVSYNGRVWSMDAANMDALIYDNRVAA
jgi:hypothetical protein